METPLNLHFWGAPIGSESLKLNQKCIKQKLEECNLLLGKYLQLNEIHEMDDSAVIGKFARKMISMVIISKWIEKNIFPILCYYPWCLILVKGWMGWISNSTNM